MPVDLSQDDLDRIDRVIGARRKIKRGETLYHNGERFSNLYAIRTGFFKTCITSEDGRDQVTGFQMAGTSEATVEMENSLRGLNSAIDDLNAKREKAAKT